MTALIFKLSSFQSLLVIIALTLASPALWVNSAKAEVIQIPVASQASELQSIPRPERGTTKTTVRNEFGEPLTEGPAIGDPPISRWEYNDYYVFFEYEHVIHTVLKHRPVNTGQQ